MGTQDILTRLTYKKEVHSKKVLKSVIFLFHFDEKSNKTRRSKMNTKKKFKKPPPLPPLILPAEESLNNPMLAAPLHPDFEKDDFNHLHPMQASSCLPVQDQAAAEPLQLGLGDIVISEVIIDEKQKERLDHFLKRKKELGDLKGDEEFEKLSELGAGNGGVVHCVTHKP